MNIGLVGSASFYSTFKKAFSPYKDVRIIGECSLQDATDSSSFFENILMGSEYLLFEEINTENFQLVTAALKNGKNVLIDSASLSMQEMHEMYSISNEANLKCMIFHSTSYYKLLEPLIEKIKNPLFIEMEVETGDENLLLDNISSDIYACLKNLMHFFKGETNQIAVKTSKIFSGDTDLIFIQLDFSNGCNANIKISSITAKKMQSIRLYLHSAIYAINLTEETIEKTEKKDSVLKTSKLNVQEINIIEKKIQHFLDQINITQTQTNSILEDYLALELSEKIIKKIN